MIKERWDLLWRRIGAHAPADAFESLSDKYDEPHRAYHNWHHIQCCLDEFERVRKMSVQPDSVEMALWFHDVVYDPRGKENEELSAALADEILYAANIQPEFRAAVHDIILATKHTDNTRLSADAAIAVDVDLAILGYPTDDFDIYELAIRKEYDWVPDDLFRKGRSAVLTRILERPHIYTTNEFRNRYELVARQNLERSLKHLRQGI